MCDLSTYAYNEYKAIDTDVCNNSSVDDNILTVANISDEVQSIRVAMLTVSIQTRRSWTHLTLGDVNKKAVNRDFIVFALNATTNYHGTTTLACLQFHW